MAVIATVLPIVVAAVLVQTASMGPAISSDAEDQRKQERDL